MIFIYILLFAACEVGVVLGSFLIAAVVAANHVGPRWVHVVLILAIFFGVIWAIIRLSLAAPMTFARRKLDVFGSWRVTRGQFWSLLGCYILAWIFAILITILGWVVSVSAGAVITGDWTSLSGAMANPRMAMMSSGLGLLTHMFTLAAGVQIVLSSLIGSVSRVVMYAPAAAAYRDLTTGPANGEARAQGLIL